LFVLHLVPLPGNAGLRGDDRLCPSLQARLLDAGHAAGAEQSMTGCGRDARARSATIAVRIQDSGCRRVLPMRRSLAQTPVLASQICAAAIAAPPLVIEYGDALVCFARDGALRGAIRQ
jgi:hypothetical protein